MARRKLKKFNPNNKDHLIILQFICRWKYVSLKMLTIRFPNKTKTHLQELLWAMSGNTVITKKDGKQKTIWFGQLRKVKNTSANKIGKPEIYYTPTFKGISQANLGYHVEPSIRDNIKIGTHTENCLKVINMLSLKENEYFTEQELWVRFKSFKESDNEFIKPRMCDFAYVSDNKFIGVEIENHIKNYKEYVADNFDPKIGIEGVSTLNKDKKTWGYFDETNFYPNEVKSKATTLAKARSDAINKGISKQIVLDPMKFGQIKKYRIDFKDAGYIELDGISIKQLKEMLAHDPQYQHQQIQKVTLVKNEDCIFNRLMYGINKKFYNEVHWYFPNGKEKPFINFIDRVFEGGYDHSFFKVFTFKTENEVKSPVNLDLLKAKQ